MGWFWHTPPRSPVDGKPAPARSTQRETQTAKPSQAQDDSAMDPEVAKFFAQFSAELKGTTDSDQEAPAAPSPQQQTSTSRPGAGASTSSAGSWFSWRSSAAYGKIPSASSPDNSARLAAAPSPATTATPTTAAEEGPDAMAASLEPPPTNCRQAFDLAFHCNGLGGQWNAVYRYGGLRDCSEKWDDFWFCMRVKSHSPEGRAAAYRQRYHEKELAKYGPGKPSSEDVWSSRDRKVEPGTAFTTPIPAIEADRDLDSVEWSRADSERRRRIREGLGFNDAGEAGQQAGAA